LSHRGVLLGFYAERDDAAEAVARLRHSGFSDAQAIYRSPGGKVHIDRATSQRRSPWALAGALAGGALGLLLARVLGLEQQWAVALVALVPALLLASVAWVIMLRRRGQIAYLAGIPFDRAADWLVGDETALAVPATTESMVSAMATLRSSGEAQPAIFAVHVPPEAGRAAEAELGAPLAIPQLRLHGRVLASEHQLADPHVRRVPLLDMLSECEHVLADTRDDLSSASRLEQTISPAGEWLLDNSYMVQSHIADVRRNLPRGFYEELPALLLGENGSTRRSEGKAEVSVLPAALRPGRGESPAVPRVYALSAELVRHTDGQITRDNIIAFLDAYQEIEELTIGELWAFPLMIRAALVDQLRVQAEHVDRRLHEREAADFWANRLLTAARRDPDRLFAVLSGLIEWQSRPSDYFAAQLIGHLYDEEIALIPVQSWLERQAHAPLSEVVAREQARQAASQVTIGNIITSLRQLSLIDWRPVFEELSHVETVLSQDPAGSYRDMDFDTRDWYRRAVEEIARGADVPETEVASAAVAMAGEEHEREAWSPRVRHVGTYLIGDGRPRLVAQVGGSETRRYRLLEWVKRHHAAVYLGSIAFWTAALTATVPLIAALTGTLSSVVVVVLTLAALLPASDLAVQIVNYWVTRLLPPRRLPKMSFEESGIPEPYRTLVVVPMLLSDKATTREEIDKLEIRYLGNPDQNLLFALLADLPDADAEAVDGDAEVIAHAVDSIKWLNARYGERFMLLVRGREWCETEGRFISWERKRGKLEELNELISGGEPRSGGEMVRVGSARQLRQVRFVITLDSDTQLPRDTARRLVETMAHPLNDPRLVEPDARRGAACVIVQPRVSTSLPSATASAFSRLFTDPVGADPYTRAVSDVYQDLAEDASYLGKGIYDPRAFHEGLSGVFREQTLLSHDLIEGAHVGCKLASDIELFDEFPPNYMTYTRRMHRWIRGDWQIAEWCMPWVPAPGGGTQRNPLNALNRWKVFDNLRRSLVPAATVVFLVGAWFVGPVVGTLASVLVGLLALFDPLARIVTALTTLKGPRSVPLHDLARAVARAAANMSLLPHQAALALDAVARVLYRRLVSRKHLLEWTTAAQAASWTGDRTSGFVVGTAVASLLSLVLTVMLWRSDPVSLVPAVVFVGLWFVSPVLAWRLNKPPAPRSRRRELSGSQQRFVRRLGRRTWRFFDEFVGPDTSWLPPDNYQVSHQDQVALRTSPTNIGLYLLSVLAASDMGYLTPADLVERLEASFEAIGRLERYSGHLLNWYDIGTLEPLRPRYVSTVDSGNLLGCLWALAAGLKDLERDEEVGRRATWGIADTLDVLEEEIRAEKLKLGSDEKRSMAALKKLVATNAGNDGAAAEQLEEHQLDEMRAHARHIEEMLSGRGGSEVAYWSAQLAGLVERWAAWSSAAGGDASTAGGVAHDATFRQRLAALREQCAELADAIDMRFLYDPVRRLFAIGFNVDEQRLDNAFYDLLASEARLASFISVARGEVPDEHWLALGRPFGMVGRHRVLLSWSGTMFEYLMPLLLQRAFDNSLLDYAAREAVKAQISYAKSVGVPWGISECAFSDLDANKTYQYKAFGVPGLGVKRGLAEEVVVAPYASMLALMVFPRRAVENLRRLESIGLYGQYGFIEAIDFSRRARRRGESGVHVRAYMAHHQGMGLLSIVNLLRDGVMQDRFHSSRRVMAAEPLLYERIPAAPAIREVPTGEVPDVRLAATRPPSESRFDTPHTDTPTTQLLSNGRYSVMVTGAGGGYSRWGEMDVTRWRADTTRDCYGTFCYLRDEDSGEVWSTAYHPTGVEADEYSVRFPIDRAVFKRLDNGIESEMTVVVSPEDDVEIRRITLTNRSVRTRHIEVTSYVELAMAPPGLDRQHPAFAKMFVHTEAVGDGPILLASRRPRHSDESGFFAGHRLIVPEDETESVSYETDRALFIGRGRSPADAVAVFGEVDGGVPDRRRELPFGPLTRDRALSRGRKADVSSPAVSDGVSATGDDPTSGASVTPEDSAARARRSERGHGGEQADATGNAQSLETAGSAEVQGPRVSGIDGLPQPSGVGTASGRGVGPRHEPREGADDDRVLSCTTGFVLDPIFSIRKSIELRPGQRRTLTFVLGVSETREGVLGAMEKYDRTDAVDRAFEMAWARAQLELRQMRINADDARAFQKLASFMLYPSETLRPPADRIEQNMRDQSGLWAHGISGDLPIALVSTSEVRDIGVVRQVLQAHAFWRQHGLEADLVILNERGTGYAHPLQEQLQLLAQAHASLTGVDKPGGVFVRIADQFTPEELALLMAVARVSIVTARGPLAQQLAGPRTKEEAPRPRRQRRESRDASAPLPHIELVHHNGWGGFTPDGKEYVIESSSGEHTPMPWSNVISNERFGTLVTEAGSGFTWCENSQRNRLTPWSNDPVGDPPGDAIFIRDEDSGAFWSPTPLPAPGGASYRTRHGAGYSVFEHNSHGIEAELTTFVPAPYEGEHDPVRIQRLRLRNETSRTRRLSITFYVEWVLGETREGSAMHVHTYWDRSLRTLLARNRYNSEHGASVAFATTTPAPSYYTGDRSEFVGRNGSLADPAGMHSDDLGERAGAALDPCGVVRVTLELAPGQRSDVTCLLGQASSADEAGGLVRKYRDRLMVDEAYELSRDWWDQLLRTIEVTVPDSEAMPMVNRWLVYQAIACRLWGRSAFYQSGGAFGFRDQLQDGLGLLYVAPQLARDQILRAARRQFPEGDVQHWWHMPSGAGVRTRISDDLLWLPYVTAAYVAATGDIEVLDEELPFIEARPLEPYEQEAYVVPSETIRSATLYEHCRLAIEHADGTGPHGLPLIGAGDWNDGLNRVGVAGQGESVWLAWFMSVTLRNFADVAQRVGEVADAERWQQRAEGLLAAIEAAAWDGEWYRRAYFDDGTPLGSAANPEARIDSLPQSWAAISGDAAPQRIERALEAAWQQLVLPDESMVLLFTPPFDQWDVDPGYIKGYPPGVRENGGQYTHAAAWLAMAYARQGQGERAVEVLRAANPVHHAATRRSAARYCVEPYAVAADVYALRGRVGQGGWTWYTGSAAWLYRVWISEVLGLKIVGGRLSVDPCIPPSWEGFTMRYRRGEAVYEIEVVNPDGVSSGVVSVELDGRLLEEPWIELGDELVRHHVVVRLGRAS